MGWRLNLMVLEVFSNLKDPVTPLLQLISKQSEVAVVLGCEKSDC